MKLHFIKMQGAGNDYVYIDGFKEHVPEDQKPSLARQLSDRHFGIGSDGLIFINPSLRADFEMEMYNADGSRGEMCGNGIRCVGKYVYDHGMTKSTDAAADLPAASSPRTSSLTASENLQAVGVSKFPDGLPAFTVESFGVVHQLYVTQTDAAGKAKILRVNMGAPILEAEQIPVIADHSPVVDEPIEVGGQYYHMTCVSMGNPHAVVFVEDVDALDLPSIGPLFEHHPRFPKRINTEFVQVLSPTEVKMRVWERGAGETLACGTGCCATGVACVLNHLTQDSITVNVRGGRIGITWDRAKNEVWMSGPAAYSFEGDVEI